MSTPQAPTSPPIDVRTDTAGSRPQPRGALSGLAVASLLLGFLWIYGVGSVLAVVCGHVALRQITRSKPPQRGRLLAQIGLLLGYLGIVLMVVVLLGTATNARSSSGLAALLG